MPMGGLFAVSLLLLYATLWIRASRLQEVSFAIDGSNVTIKKGDIFTQYGLKAIAFNEYFDTVVDDKIISRHSLNGVFITDHLDGSVPELDEHIASYPFEENERIGTNVDRSTGKRDRFAVGTICVYGDYLLTAFARFDEHNRAWLTMPEYLAFLVNFWDSVNRVYSQRSVTVPIFGSGITRIKEHKNISDEELLKIMLWTFRISEMRFKYPAKLIIVIHPDKIDRVNLLDIKTAKNGL